MTTLNHRINIEQRSSTTDALGQPLETWTLVAAVWADVRHLSGTAALKAGADTSLVQASIRIRQRSGLNAGLRVVHGSDVYDIRAVLPDGKNEYIDLVCQRVA